MNRWVRLSAAILTMVMVGNLQYAWTLFVQPIISTTHWKLSDVQLGFTLFIALGTWAMPLSGLLIDRMGPRVFMVVSGILCGVGWWAIGRATTLLGFYTAYSVAGFGVAFVYCCAMAMAMKWFPDKRGLASGLSAAGYGSGAALFNPIFSHMIHSLGHQATFFYSGIVQGAVILLAGLMLQNPKPGEVPQIAKAKPKVRSHHEEFTSWEMLKCPQFYVLYAMMLAVGVGGLMATAQVAPVARSFNIVASALSLALILNPLANGGGRIFWGWVSDHLGRERTMFVAFGIQALCLLGVTNVAKTGSVAFVVVMALVFFTWGELYVLFPAVLADLFGAKHSSANYSILYSTKGVAVILGSWLAARLFEKTGSWDTGFYGCAALALCASLASIALHKMPLPKKRGAETAAPSLARAQASD